MPVETLAVLWAVFIVVGAIIGEQRGMGALQGAFLGLFLGPLGWLIAAFQKPKQPPPSW